MEMYGSQGIVDIVENLRNSIVTVRTSRYGRDQWGRIDRMVGSGTGMIISSSGYIATNFHVVSGSSGITVITPDNAKHSARVVGYDEATDLAVIKINALDLNSCSFGDSSAIRPGQPVIAVGNALALPGGPTVSYGVVSAVGRILPWSEFITEGLVQTDAAINPGNSGGPLATVDGLVIGMNTAIVPFAQGVGFAIPSNTVKTLIQQILEQGKVRRSWIGLSGVSMEDLADLQERPGFTGGVMVASTVSGGPADIAGIRRGDIITEFAGKPVNSMRDLIAAISSLETGKDASAVLYRGRRRLEISVITDQMPPDYLQRFHGEKLRPWD
ncbi:MAG: trypsin-like peptidase domain-containing protein [Thermoplasmataceae archaeon]